MNKKKSVGVSIFLIHLLTAVLPILLVTIAYFTQNANMQLFIIIACVLAFVGIVLQYLISTKKSNSNRTLIAAFKKAKEG